MLSRNFLTNKIQLTEFNLKPRLLEIRGLWSQRSYVVSKSFRSILTVPHISCDDKQCLALWWGVELVSWGDEDGPYMAIPICLNQSETAAAAAAAVSTAPRIISQNLATGTGQAEVRAPFRNVKCEVWRWSNIPLTLVHFLFQMYFWTWLAMRWVRT